MRSFLSRFHYKELFLVGFYVSFIVITSLAAVIDHLIGKRFDAMLDVLFVIIGSGFFYGFLKTRNAKVASSAILWIASTIVFVFMIVNEFDLSIVFSLMLPMVAFVLMSPREILINMSLYFLILGSIFTYGFVHYEHHQVLHDSSFMSAYLIALLFVFAFGIIYHFAIEQAYRELKRADRQKEVLLKEIHHRIKNNLNIISSILGLQRLETDDKQVHHIIDQNRLRIESIALVHEVLYQTEDLAEVDFEKYARRLIEHILMMSDLKEQIVVELQVVKSSFSLERMVQLGIIINELVTNSVKHAFLQKDGRIEMRLTDDAGYYLTYTDSGGDVADLQTILDGDSLGLSLIRLTTEQMQGSMTLENRGALHYGFRFAS